MGFEPRFYGSVPLLVLLKLRCQSNPEKRVTGNSPIYMLELINDKYTSVISQQLCVIVLVDVNLSELDIFLPIPYQL